MGIQNLSKLVVFSPLLSYFSLVNIPFKMTKKIIFIAFLGLLTLNLTQSFPQNKPEENLNTKTSDKNVILTNEKDKSNNNRPVDFNSFGTAGRDEEKRFFFFHIKNKFAKKIYFKNIFSYLK